MTGSPSGNSGCFSALLRHLLCSGGAPTHPSDDALAADPSSNRTTDADPIFFKGSPKRDSARTHRPPQKPAGVVARLMGLESLPDAKWVPKARSPDAFLRSRSVNFMDYLLELDLGEDDRNRHRRVRTSVSFRELPTPLAQEKSEDLIVLYLGDEEDLGKSKKKKKKGESRGKRKQKTATKKKKKKMESEREEGKERKVSRLRDEPRLVRGGQRHRGGQHCAELKLMTRKPLMAAKDKEALAGDLEFANGGRSNKRAAVGGGEISSSPASVLDQPLESPLQAYAEDNINRHFGSLQFAHIILDPFVRDKKPCNNQIDRSPVVDRFVEEVTKVRKLAEEDVQSSKWFSVGEMSTSLGSANLEVLSAMIEHHVLDHLVEEVVRFL